MDPKIHIFSSHSSNLTHLSYSTVPTCGSHVLCQGNWRCEQSWEFKKGKDKTGKEVEVTSWMKSFHAAQYAIHAAQYDVFPKPFHLGYVNRGSAGEGVCVCACAAATGSQGSSPQGCCKKLKIHRPDLISRPQKSPRQGSCSIHNLPPSHLKPQDAAWQTVIQRVWQGS